MPNAVISDLLDHSAAFAANRFDASIKIMPGKRLLVLGCVDPRVDPVDVFGLGLGDAAVLRNVGGRVTPDIVNAIALLRGLVEVSGGQFGAGWNLVVLHHTDCGIRKIAQTSPDPLAAYLGVPAAGLPALHIHDPRASIAADLAVLRAHDRIPNFTVTGLCYDVATGKLETVVDTAPLRA